MQNLTPKIVRRKTRSVLVRDLIIGSAGKISVQSMCATKTQDISATLNQVAMLVDHGADVIRIAVDSRKDVEALAEIRKATTARLVVDLQESYKLAENPGLRPSGKVGHISCVSFHATKIINSFQGGAFEYLA
ncbi:MAG: hypothetical protein EBZ48_09450, partial [Proteobacteria bacterium]|nr:hypothetical protein [Pseudomonadota bacterium]